MRYILAMERKYTRRRLTLRRAPAVMPAVIPQHSPYRGPYQIHEGFDFDLRELNTDDVEFIDQSHYENEFHRQISNTIALHGVKV